MSQIPSSQPRPRSDLPIWETVCASFRSVFVENLNHLPNAVVGPLVLSLVIGALLVITGGSILTSGRGGTVVAEGLLFIVLLFAALAPYVIFAVAWHRVILLGPAVAPPTVIPSWQNRHWRFYGYSLLIGLLSTILFLGIVGVPLLVVYYVIGSRVLQGLTAVVGFVVASTIILRLCLVFPATAVDERYGLGDAMRQSEKQGLRLAASTFLISIPFFVVDGIARLMLVNPSSDALKSQAGILILLILAMIWLILHTIISYLQSAVIISFLSLSFRYLSGWQLKDGSAAPLPPEGDVGFDAT